MAAVVAHHALRAARRTRRVEDVERIGGTHRDAADGLGGGDELDPVVVAPRAELGLALRALEHDTVVGRMIRLGQRGIEQRLVGQRARALEPARGRHDHARACVVDAHGQLVRREAAEDDRVDRPRRAHASIAISASGTIGR